MATSDSSSSRSGIAAAFGCYLCWGLFPLYWIPLQQVPAMQILGHRMVWSALLIVGILAWRRHWQWLLPVWRQPRQLGVFALSASLLACNWLTFIWAVNNGHVIEASLGYFVNPLVNILLGRMVLGERLNRIQLAAISVSVAGVAWLTWQVGSLPWIALVLAGTFGVYGLMRKMAPMASLEGLALETFLLFPVALGGLLWVEWQGQGVFGHAPLAIDWLLVGTGAVTTIPLLLFAAAARRLTLTTLGFFQYLAPSIQFFIGLTVFREPFDAQRLVGFGLIWCALLIYSMPALARLVRRPGRALV